MKLPSSLVYTAEHEVTSVFGPFTLLSQSPTWDALTTDLTGRSGQLIEHRIRSTVIGWKGVQNEAGEEVAFSWDVLADICRADPEVFMQVRAIAHQRFATSVMGQKKL